MSNTKDIIKFHAIGDIHISNRHLSLTREALNGCIQLVKKCKDVDLVVIMGDVFDTHDVLRLNHLHTGLNFIQEMSKLRPTAVLVGNHDRIDNKDYMSDIHPYMGVNDIKSKEQTLWIISKPKAVKIRGHYVLFMPFLQPGRFIEGINYYISTMHKYEKLLDVKSPKDFSLIFAHQEFKGAPCGPIESTIGDDWPLDYPMVVSGHIHSRLLLKPNIYYTGSLYPITSSESNDKGVITGSYNPATKELSLAQPVRVVMSQKVILHIDAKDSSSVMEMVTLNRANTKYIVTGTPEDLAEIKNKAKGQTLNIMYDARPIKVVTTNITFDDILSAYLDKNQLTATFSEVSALL